MSPVLFRPTATVPFPTRTFYAVNNGITSYRLDVYNRWGQLVYSTDTGHPWTGLIDGRPVPDELVGETILELRTDPDPVVRLASKKVEEFHLFRRKFSEKGAPAPGRRVFYASEL
jgi:hypothetical protein